MSVMFQTVGEVVQAYVEGLLSEAEARDLLPIPKPSKSKFKFKVGDSADGVIEDLPIGTHVSGWGTHPGWVRESDGWRSKLSDYVEVNLSAAARTITKLPD